MNKLAFQAILPGIWQKIQTCLLHPKCCQAEDKRAVPCPLGLASRQCPAIEQADQKSKARTGRHLHCMSSVIQDEHSSSLVALQR